MKNAAAKNIAGRVVAGRRAGVASAMLALAGGAGVLHAQQRTHFTYLWHLEQPIYWPDQQASGADRYELAWQSIQRRDAGQVHPTNNLREIFGLDDRRNAYQWRVRDSINAMRGRPEAGAQVSYSGGLIENIMSLGNANQLGYSPTWYAGNREARNWFVQGSGSIRRLDIVQFGFHHPLMPLIDTTTLRKELQLYREIYPDAWGAGTQSRGLFPSEMAFSTRMVEALAQENIAWVIVSSEKISRACADFPTVFGSGGINTDAPNKADQVNPAQGAGAYVRFQIDRGCSPAEAAPLSFTPRRARYVNPATGAVSSVIVVPASQSFGWKDGYAPLSLSDMNTLDARNDPSRPQLLLLAHDGDNAWGGGFSYYMEATPNLVNNASNAGFVPTVVEKYLADHPVPANDFVHVEDGAWVNADGDFGSPQFINWNWPLINATGQIDIDNGWHIDARNWAIITAANNRVVTAEQIATRAGGPQPAGLNNRRILSPDASTTGPERAWHYFLGSLNSGYMYYGNAEDFEVKPTIACNEAMQHADPVIGTGTLDATSPTVWTLQRHPWNPGSVAFGPQYGYQQRPQGPDFAVWTFAYDVSGIASAVLKWRVDLDGQRSLSNTENETYAGGAGVGPWQSIGMTQRAFPAGNVFNQADLNLFEMPQYIADQYTARIVGQSNRLIDYYVEMTDSRGNITRSPIHHVWVGDGQGGGGNPTGPAVSTTPAQPVAGQQVVVTYDPAGRPLAGAGSVCMYWGINQWSPVVSTSTPMALVNNKWTTTITLPSNATQLDMVFNNCAASTWDNNGGADWHVAVNGGVPTPQWTMDGVRDSLATQVGTNGGMRLDAGLIGDVLYVAANDAGEGQDHFVFVAQQPGALVNAPWAKAGQVSQWSAFLADENSNDFEGWFDAVGTRAAATGANGGVLEGTINLREELGLGATAPLPEFVWLAVGAFGNNDGGSLVPGLQVAASSDNNTTLNANEYVRVRLCDVRVGGCVPACNSIDFNNDGLFPDDADLIDFLNVLAGGACGTGACDGIDFNNDGLFPDDADLAAFLRVLAGGAC
jgi:hypothetical protein